MQEQSCVPFLKFSKRVLVAFYDCTYNNQEEKWCVVFFSFFSFFFFKPRNMVCRQYFFFFFWPTHDYLEINDGIV